MEKTLGQMIGTVTDTFSITNARGEKVQISVKWDFTTSTDTDIKSWLCGNRRIAFQRGGLLADNNHQPRQSITVGAVVR